MTGINQNTAVVVGAPELQDVPIQAQNTVARSFQEHLCLHLICIDLQSIECLKLIQEIFACFKTLCRRPIEYVTRDK